jgi:hypothetical protein
MREGVRTPYLFEVCPKNNATAINELVPKRKKPSRRVKKEKKMTGKEVFKPGVRQRLELLKKRGKIILFVTIGVLLFLFVMKIKRKIESQVTIIRNNGRCRGVPTDETIFVAITSTRSEMERTVRCVGELFDACACPKRVVVGICQTGMDDVRKHGGWKPSRFMERYRRVHRKHGDAFDNNIRVINEPVNETKGFSNAMNLIQTYLYRGERFFMTLDNSLSLIKDWDTVIVEDLKRCLLRSRKPIITQAPTWSRSRGAGWRATPPSNPTFLRATGWTEWGTPVIEEEVYKNPPVRPFRSLFYTSAFSFASGNVVKDVTFDPWYQHLPRDAVDWSHAVRLWTSGWDFYCPSKNMVARADPSDNETSRDYAGYDSEEGERAYYRLWCFLGLAPPGIVDLSGFEAGRQRDQDQYRNFCGVDWKSRSLYPHARVGMSLVDPSRRRTRDLQYPFENEEVVAKYGSWTDFYEITDYRSDDVQRV